MVLGNSTGSLFCGFAFAFDLAAKTFTIGCDACPESRITRFLETRYLKDLDRIDGERMEFEWKVFPGITTLGILDEVQKMMTKSKCEPEQFKGNVQ